MPKSLALLFSTVNYLFREVANLNQKLLDDCRAAAFALFSSGRESGADGGNLLEHIHATRFIKRMTAGVNKPALFSGILPGGGDVEFVAKFTHSFDLPTKQIISEAVGTLLAADLGLPVPEPFIAEVEQSLVDDIADDELRRSAMNSSSFAFASKLLPPGFGVWSESINPYRTKKTRNQLAEIFCFDALIQNCDRGDLKPNCLIKGKKIAIIDHDKAFSNLLVPTIGAVTMPWEIGGLQEYGNNGKHIFFKLLNGFQQPLETLRDRWSALSDARINQYLTALPIDWFGDDGYSEEIVSYLRAIRDNIDDSMIEICRILNWND